MENKYNYRCFKTITKKEEKNDMYDYFVNRLCINIYHVMKSDVLKSRMYLSNDFFQGSYTA